MAHIIPHVDVRTIEHGSEVPVYEAFRDQLSDDFVVIHSYPWLRRWRPQRSLAEGEIDFVILHRELGLLVLEVKGGSGIRYDGKCWYRDAIDGPKAFKDPFDQARRNMHALVEIIEERSDGILTRHGFAYGYAVVFPHVDYEDPPPPHADRGIIISRRNLAFIEESIRTALNAWGMHSRVLGRAQYDTLLHDCLLPTFRLVRRVGPEISFISDSLLELTEQQVEVFAGLYLQRRVLVMGVAGSGKTFLALHRALAFARSGQRTLFVCFNNALARWIQWQVEIDSQTRGYQSRLFIRNFHRLAKELVDESGLDFTPSSGTRRSDLFWDEEVPDLLEQAVWIQDSIGKDVRYDALVIDEAQDFSQSWWYVLVQSLLRNKEGAIYAFMDPNQSLRGESQVPPIKFDTVFNLSINCRNTRRIARASASVLDLSAPSSPGAPIGPPLVIHRATSPESRKRLLFNEIHRLLVVERLDPAQLALIGPTTKANGSVADMGDVEGTRLVTSPHAWREGGGILVTTSRSFKGLEADVVVLYDLGRFSNLFQKRDLYVACTRAKSLLVAICDDGECYRVLESALRASGDER